MKLRKVYSIIYKGITVLDHMTQKKLMLRNEISQIINIITEDNDSISAIGDVRNIQDVEQQAAGYSTVIITIIEVN
jgi:hypothetical protein